MGFLISSCVPLSGGNGGNLWAVVCTALIIAANDALKGSRRR